MKIIGVDPGSEIMGVAVIQDVPKLVVLEVQAHILDVKQPRLKRLFSINQIIEGYMQKYFLDVLAIEDQYVGKSRRGSLHLAEAKNTVTMKALERGMQVCEYPPCAVKKSVTGDGMASKQTVKRFMEGIFGIDLAKMPFDASDALAIALCCANKRRDKIILGE